MPKRKRFDDFWDELECRLRDSGLVSTISASIKEILTSSGYNSAISFLNIDESRIKQIEEFVEGKCRPLIDSFNEYVNTIPFAFLPGHRECIFGIKSELLKMQNNKKSKGAHRQGNSENDPKISLIKQLESFAKKNGISSEILDIEWADVINNFKVTDNRADCSIKCPYCDKSTSVSCITFWKLSNYFRHLRQHIVEVVVDNTSEIETEEANKEDQIL